MVFTSASLPLPSNNVNHHGRRVGFEVDEPKGFWSQFREKLVCFIHSAIHAQTGSPSDGLGGDSESSTSTSVFIAAQKMLTAEKDGDNWEVDEVVVSGEDHEHHHRLGMDTSTERTTSASPCHSSHDADSLRRDSDNILPCHSSGLASVLRAKWKTVLNFFNPKFDESIELDFRKQHWYSTKTWAFYGSLFLVINWVLYLILNISSTKHTVYAQVLFYGGLSLLTIPLPVLIAMDVPFRHPVPFQIWFAIAVWYCGITETIQTHICHFFIRPNTCFGKDFLAMLYYNTAMPALMMFVVSDRLYNAIMQVIEFILLMSLVIPVQGIYARNLVSFTLFSIFLQGLHYNREMTERRLYLLNSQLKIAYKAQQKAQMAQARASHAKRRFASYIFHEVRVPLNNAAIAFNNMTTNEAFRQEFMQENSLGEDVEALDVSLATVQQVLNDSLDLEKMDAGHFDINPRPFPLHRVIRSTLGPLIVSATAKNFALHVNLDERIDRPQQGPLSNNAYTPLPVSLDPSNATSSSPLQGAGAGGIDSGSGIEEHETWVVGDEVRLRQVLTNLASNAVKFTPEGTASGVTVSTMLVARRRPGVVRRRSTAASRGAAGRGAAGRGAASRGVAGRGAAKTRAVAEAETAVGDGSGRDKKRPGIVRKLSTGAGGGAAKAGAETVVGDGAGRDRKTDTKLTGRNLEKRRETEDGNGDGGRLREQAHTHTHVRAHQHLQHSQGHHESGSTQNQEYLVFRLEISDSGPGIKPSDFADNQLFQPFAQTEVGKLSKNSTGLGLAIVRQIVSLSGGKLGVQSQKGRGATFWVELTYPIAQAPDVEALLTSSSPPSQLPSFFAAQTPAGVASKGMGMTQPHTMMAFAENAQPSHPHPMPMTVETVTVPEVAATIPPSPSTPGLSMMPSPPGFERQESDEPLLKAQSQPLSRSGLGEGVGDAAQKSEKVMPEATAVGVVPPKPVGDTPIQMQRTEATAVTTEGDKPLLVLIVDDNKITRETMSRSLRKRGCMVDTAKNGKECLDMVLGPNAKMYDLISLDNDMPVMTGEDAVKEIRLAGRDDIFVVGCTGNALTEDQTRYLEAGVDQILAKPIRFELLPDILDTARQKRQQRLSELSP